MLEQFTIKQLVAVDWMAFRDIRLESLKAHPEFFCPSRDEFAFGENDWRERLSNPNGASFGLYNGSGELIGLTGIIREGNQEKAQTAQLVSSYIRKEYRNRGLSALLYEARIEWAREQENLRQIGVEHSQKNAPSYRAHQRFGFRYRGQRVQRFKDGSDRICEIYQLDLEP